MTLCIARKQNGIIDFSSDSRIKLEELQYIDFGIKIFSIHVNISSALINGADVIPPTNFNIGLCISGSVTSSYIIKEAIEEMLLNLQAAPLFTDISMENICKLICKIHDKVSNDICAYLQERGVTELLITGYCPTNDTIRSFKIYDCELNITRKSKYKEILIDDGIEFIGSGSFLAEKIFQKDENLHPLKIIKQAILDDSCVSVGGGLQYGKYENNDFKIFGVREYEIDENGNLDTMMRLRGLDVMQETFNNETDFLVTPTFFSPFENEINELLNQP